MQMHLYQSYTNEYDWAQKKSPNEGAQLVDGALSLFSS